MTLHLLYIDPGTGSMLFSILIGAAATFFFVFRALLIKIKLFFSGGVRGGGGAAVFGAAAAAQYVIYCEGKQYFNVFKPVLDEFEKRKINLVYLTSSSDDPVFEINFEYIKSEYIGEGNKAFARLNMLNADFVLMTTPGLQVYQLKRSRLVKHYSHILHAPSDATMYRLFGIDYFDSILLTGSYQADDIRKLEDLRGLPEKQLVTVGCTYLDVYAEKIKLLPPKDSSVFTVLVSPSWGDSALLSRYGEKLLSPLVKTGWRIIARPHPQSKKSEAEMLRSLMEKYKDAANLEWDYERENIYSLSKADIMISDFSGIIFDYVFLFDKPVLYVNHKIDMRLYDADDLLEDADGCYDSLDRIWQFRTLKEIGIELLDNFFDSIGEIIKNASDSAGLKAARHKAKDEAWQHRGMAGELTADFMIQTVNEIEPDFRVKNPPDPRRADKE
ncbi:MAG: CDP-glycerol glycerophosphotransferase family protein [Spirochaetaceae bacterium]|nr:CDP-glycerol glycerophosphotransferase family protein [Spirochaetaceae bacterium]